MILSDSRNFIFVHIPKTGGTSMHAMLKPALDTARDLDVMTSDRADGPRDACGIDPDAPLMKHSSARRMVKLLGPEKFASMFSFTVVRNPFARAYSAFSYARWRARYHEDAHERERRKNYLDLSFEDVAADLPAYANSMKSLKSMTRWLHRPDAVSYVARLETLAADWALIRAVLNIEDVTDAIPARENVSTDTPEWQNMSPAAARHVAEYYADDFKAFGYDPHLPSTASGVK